VKISVSIDLKTVVRWVLGILFVWAAVSKLANPTKFLGSILAYEMPLPQNMLRLTAIALPWLELLCGLTLLANFWAESALAVMLGLFCIFILATGSAWARGLDISCGCFDLSMMGINAESKTMQFLESARFAFFRNIVLAAFVAYLLLCALPLETPAKRPA